MVEDYKPHPVHLHTGIEPRSAPNGRDGARSQRPSARINWIAQTWAEQLVKNGKLSHNPSYSALYAPGWKVAAENVQQNMIWVTAEDLIKEWHGSPDHRVNLQNPAFNTFGVGIAYGNDGRIWAAQDFARY